MWVSGERCANGHPIKDLAALIDHKLVPSVGRSVMARCLECESCYEVFVQSLITHSSEEGVRARSNGRGEIRCKHCGRLLGKVSRSDTGAQTVQVQTDRQSVVVVVGSVTCARCNVAVEVNGQDENKTLRAIEAGRDREFDRRTSWERSPS